MTLELLAPAKNLEFGREAINHGADALYIGAPAFGARAAATNTIEDIVGKHITKLYKDAVDTLVEPIVMVPCPTCWRCIFRSMACLP